MRFEDIIGQENGIRNLRNALALKRVAHAYLLCGPDGTGKSIAASILAAAVNCREKGADPCGNCPSCIRAEKGSHPDIIHISINKPSISVNDVRDIEKDMGKKPYQDGMKVYIIHGADKMTEQAQNAFLKTLEEPHERVLIILTAANQYSFLPTLVSRCQVIKFTRASNQEIEGYLLKTGAGVREARLGAAYSGGIVGKALEIMNDGNLNNIRGEVINIIRNLASGDKSKALSYADYFMNNKDKIEYIMDIMMSWVRDLAVFKECGHGRYLINADREDMIASEASSRTPGSLNRIIRAIKETGDNIKSNANFQLSIEVMLLKIQEG